MSRPQRADIPVATTTVSRRGTSKEARGRRISDQAAGKRAGNGEGSVTARWQGAGGVEEVGTAWRGAYRFYLAVSCLRLSPSPGAAAREAAAKASGCVGLVVGGEGRGGWPEGAAALRKVRKGDFTAVAGDPGALLPHSPTNLPPTNLLLGEHGLATYASSSMTHMQIGRARARRGMACQYIQA